MKRVIAFGIREPEIDQILNFIRYIANTSEKRKAHVTVIGPVSETSNIELKNSIIEDQKILVTEPGCFFNGKQNTVYLKCAAASIRSVWKKNFPDYTPHISIYDGKSRQFAEQLLNLFKKLDITFTFHATSLFEILLHKHQLSLDLVLSIDFSYIGKVTKIKIDPNNAVGYSESKRLQIILSAASFLNRKKVEELKKYPIELKSGRL
jgi:hypothetical protein